MCLVVCVRLGIHICLYLHVYMVVCICVVMYTYMVYALFGHTGYLKCHRGEKDLPHGPYLAEAGHPE